MQQDLLICRPCRRNFRVERGVFNCPHCGLPAAVWEATPIEDESLVDLGVILDDIRDALSDEKKDGDE